MVLREWASDCFCPTLPFRTSNRSNQKCNSQSQESQEGFLQFMNSVKTGQSYSVTPFCAMLKPEQHLFSNISCLSAWIPTEIS